MAINVLFKFGTQAEYDSLLTHNPFALYWCTDTQNLYKRDVNLANRKSHENAEIKALYKEFYKEPLSELAEKMLHTSYVDRSADLG